MCKSVNQTLPDSTTGQFMAFSGATEVCVWMKHVGYIFFNLFQYELALY